ncbi:cytochrome b [Sphingomonas sp. Tas61C01]|uniref:cytochrome b n=1 Tax=Sphingomonas sp. Tas61C01 TaxID=3458297 RepID=UPI00403EE82C
MAYSSTSYSRVAIALHWSMAVLIIANLFIGLFGDAIETLLGGSPFPLHKSIGLTVLALALFRIAWRLTHKPPPLTAADTGRLEHRLAGGVHLLLYALMVVMPMSGWIMSSAGKSPLGWFGLFSVPKFAVTRADPIVGASGATHHYLGYLMAALVIGHIAAALRHHFLLRDGVLRRMLPS